MCSNVTVRIKGVVPPKLEEAANTDFRRSSWFKIPCARTFGRLNPRSEDLNKAPVLVFEAALHRELASNDRTTRKGKIRFCFSLRRHAS